MLFCSISTREFISEACSQTGCHNTTHTLNHSKCRYWRYRRLFNVLYIIFYLRLTLIREVSRGG